MMSEALRMLEPHEGIGGQERREDALLTVGGSLLAAEMMGYLSRATLVGNPVPIVQQMRARIDEPRPGDAVVVYDSIFQRDDETKHKGVGYLVEVREEWASTAEEWAESIAEDGSLTDADRWVERRAWYVQYGPEPEDVCRWTNCTVLAIPRAAGDGF